MVESISPETLAEAMESALAALLQYPTATGLAAVMYPEDHGGHTGLAVAWEMYTGPDILSAYRTNMRSRVRPDMVGMMLGVKNILPGKETYQDVALELMANEQDMNVHNVSKAMDTAMARNGDAFEGDHVVMVTALLTDHTWLNVRSRNAGQPKFFRDDSDWDTAPAVIAMRYWMDMPV